MQQEPDDPLAWQSVGRFGGARHQVEQVVLLVNVDAPGHFLLMTKVKTICLLVDAYSPNCSSTSFWLVLLTRRQYAASKLPRHECAVAEKAPGRPANGAAPIDFANTSARAEFCVPTSMEMVRAVCSFEPTMICLGIQYPAPTATRAQQ